MTDKRLGAPRCIRACMKIAPPIFTLGDVFGLGILHMCSEACHGRLQIPPGLQLESSGPDAQFLSAVRGSSASAPNLTFGQSTVCGVEDGLDRGTGRTDSPNGCPERPLDFLQTGLQCRIVFESQGRSRYI
jgi:hypothetical protein